MFQYLEIVQYLEIRPEFDVDFRSVVADDLHLVCGGAIILVFHFANPALANTRQGWLACFVPVSSTEALAGPCSVAQGLIIAGRADSGGNCGSSQGDCSRSGSRDPTGLFWAWRSPRYLPSPSICALIVCSQYSTPSAGVPGFALSANSLRE